MTKRRLHHSRVRLAAVAASLLATELLVAGGALANGLVEPELDPDFQGATVEVVVQTTPERFLALNATDQPMIFLFGTADGSRVVERIGAPGEKLDYPFPAVMPTGLAFEIVKLTDMGWVASGAISVTTYRDAGFTALWAHAPELSTSFWLTYPDGLRFVPVTSLLPPSMRAAMVAEPAGPIAPYRLQPRHVPVISPNDKPSEDAPPKLEKDPLPPV